MPDVDLAIRHPALQSIVQQRLNCALPSFSLKLWFLSIPKSSRHVQELLIDWLLDLAVDLFNRSSNLEIRRR